MHGPRTTLTTLVLILALLAAVSNAMAGGFVGGCCLEDGSCTDTDEASCTALGGAYAGDGPTCVTIVCEAVPFAFALSPGSTTVPVPQFDDQGGSRQVILVTMQVNRTVNLSMTLTNNSTGPLIRDTTVTYSGNLDATLGPLDTLTIGVNESVDCGPGATLGPGESCDFGGPISFTASATVMSPPPVDLSAFVGPGTIDLDVDGTGITIFPTTVPFTLSIPAHGVQGTAIVVYQFWNTFGACCLPESCGCTVTTITECLSADGLFAGVFTDCSDFDGQPGSDVCGHLGPDCNQNGIPDGCECVGDLDGDGNVGFTDLSQLLGAWGPCPGCPEDVDCNGTVGFTDLNDLLAGWGPCT